MCKYVKIENPITGGVYYVRKKSGRRKKYKDSILGRWKTEFDKKIGSKES